MKEIDLPQAATFSIGNPGTVSHKYLVKTQKLLLKGKKLGFCEVLIWQAGKRGKRSLKIYVIERRKHLKAIQSIDAYERLGLKTEIIGDFLKVSGEISKLSHYQQFQRLKSEAPASLLLEGVIGRSLKKELIGTAYRAFFRAKLKEFRCDTQNLDFICYTPSLGPIPAGVLADLKKQTFVQIIETDQTQMAQNFSLKLKLLQLEGLSGEELHFGLDRLSANLGEIFDSGLRPLVTRNQILLNNQQIDLSTLAEPNGLIRLGHPAEFKIGAEVPYQAQINLESGTSSKEWKFVGLSIKLTLKREAGHFVIFYETNFSTPGGASDEFSGNFESSTAIVPLGRPLELFQIGMKTVGSKTSGLPLLSKIPLLGRLFQSKGEHTTHKKITGLILLEAHELTSSTTD